MNPSRTLTLAGIQVESRNGDVDGNLSRAEALVQIAAGRGAQLVLCPELMAAGYVYHSSLWNAAEPRGGPTELWLARMARQHRLYIGATYLEAVGEDFFNTFTLISPDGTVAGRVRKQSLPGFEGWFFRGCSAPKVIDTPLGRIGVGICWDNDTARFMHHISRERIDLLLMPHSAPFISFGPLKLVGQDARKRLRSLTEFYASALGVPAMMVNKAAGRDTLSPIPGVPLMRLRFRNMGQSTICDAGGKVCDQLHEEPGVVFGEVTLDHHRKCQPSPLPTGYWSRPPHLFPRATATIFRLLECIGKTAYSLSQSRRRAARNIDETKGAAPS